MNPMTAALLTGGIVAVANLTQKKPLTFRQLAGTGLYAIILAVINESAPDIASKLGLLVLIGALLKYGTEIFDATGLAS